MAAVIRLDTHVVVWLYTGEVERLSPATEQRLSHDDLLISPLVELELTYLHQVGRLTVTGAVVVGDLRERVGLALSAEPLAAVAAAAAPLGWTRDPFDRLIVADALSADTALLTEDAAIRAHFPAALW